MGVRCRGPGKGSGGGAPGGGAGGSASGGTSSGAGDAGPSCTPLAQIPKPVSLGVDLRASCGLPSACSGAVAGTSWALSSVCLDASKLFPQAAARCSDLETQLIQAGLTGASCSPVCNGGTCNCTVSSSMNVQSNDGYSESGGKITSGTVTLSACTSGKQLALQDPGTNTTYTRWSSTSPRRTAPLLVADRG